MQAELSYLFDLIRAFVGGSAEAPAAPVGLDWVRLGQLLQEHHVVSTLNPLLQRSAAAEDWKTRLDTESLHHAMRSALLEQEMLRGLRRLDAAGVACLPLKGFALGLTVYPALERRFLADLDILVPEAECERAVEALRHEGYDHADVRPAVYYRDHHFHWHLRNASGVSLELHWDLATPSSYFRFDAPSWFERATELTAEGLNLKVPSNSDQLLHTANQALLAGFADLRRIVDAALLLRSPAWNERELARRAGDHGLATALWTLLRLQQRIAGVPVSESLLALIQPDDFARRCLESLPLEQMRFGRWMGPKGLVLFLSAPSLASARRQIGRFLIPDDAQLLTVGYAPDALPGPVRRTTLCLARSASLAKAAGYLWCSRIRALGS